MNAYDFDNTIYDGESIYDFFIFAIKTDKRLLKFFPRIFILLIKYKLNKVKITDIYDTASLVIEYFINESNLSIDEMVSSFWVKNEHKLKKEFLNMLKSDDLIITGCPNFLIEYVKPKLKTDNIICTDYDNINNKINFICLGENKVKAFNEKYKNVKINKFYTDSLVDSPFMKISNEVYLVKKNKIIKISKQDIK